MSQLQRDFSRMRISVNLQISIKALTESERVDIINVQDISYSGAKLISPKPFQVGDDSNMLIHWHKEKLNIVATIRRCQKIDQGYDLGVEFVTISRKDLKHIQEILKEAQ